MIDKRKCDICGMEFQPKDRKQQYCSIKCGRVKSAESQRKYYSCQHCGELFWRPNAFRMKYCGEECRRVAYSKQHPKSEKAPPKQYKRACLYCDEIFISRYPNQKYCSKECSYNGNLRIKREQWADSFVSIKIKCKECGDDFMTECGDKHSVFCCQACANKYERRVEHSTHRHKQYMRVLKKRREEQISTAFVEEVHFEQIYKRDHGICQICGLPVNPVKSIDNNWDGTIDHITPLSKGGKHSMENCQLSHRICNSLKCTDDSNFKINWVEKSQENNFWNAKYQRGLELICMMPGPV